MTLEAWVKNGWLREYETSRKEVRGVLELVDRDLLDAARDEISTDWQFDIAYNAALQLATIVLYAGGYRTGRGESKHYRIIQALPLVMGAKYTATCTYLDNCRRKRNLSEYDAVGTISETEAKDLLAFAHDLKKEVLEWLTNEHPSLLSG
jgi:hypothetical protein